MKSYSYSIEPRFRDTDTLGHINNAVYLTYVESCRTHFCQDVLGYKLFETGERIPIILARAEIDFLAQGHLHHKIRVEAKIAHIGTKSFTQDYHIMAGDLCLAKSRAVLVWFNFETQLSEPIPDLVRQGLAKYLSQ